MPGKNFLYKAFGLRIASDFFLPELPRLNGPVDRIEVEIKQEEILMTPGQTPYEFEVENEAVSVYFPDAGTFSISEGKTIRYTPAEDADEDLIRLYILGTCMGALLMQRRVLPLHGSAVAISGKAYAFIGDSGAGKSTLASTFLKMGYQIISDDVIAVSLTAEDTPLVTPAYPQQKLWQDTLDNFGLAEGNYRPIYGRQTKYNVSVVSHYFPDPLPLAGIFELIRSQDDKIEIQQVVKLESLQTLFTHTYRNFLIQPMDLLEWHFNTSLNIQKTIDFFRIKRPASGFSAPQVAALILEKLGLGGRTPDEIHDFSS